MSRADKRACRHTERLAWLKRKGGAVTDRTYLGTAAARPPDAPPARPITCTACPWTSRRHEFYYLHPKGQRDTVRQLPSGALLKPCPRCGAAVRWAA
jgi:hypothetical protein